MRAVVQRVLSASVSIGGEVYSSIDQGFLILLGVEREDTLDDVKYLASKCFGLRVFDDSEGVMNLSLSQVEGEVIVVSQFTLQASTKRGNRPSYIKAAPEEISRPLYEAFVAEFQSLMGKEVKTGVFKADMKVSLCNDGPVTIFIDSKNIV